jgi:hypothetical protein
VVFAVVAVKHHHHALVPLRGRAHARDNLRLDGRAEHVGDARMHRQPIRMLHVDGDDVAGAEPIELPREEQRRATERRAGLNHERRPAVEEQLLIDPQVHRVLDQRHALEIRHVVRVKRVIPAPMKRAVDEGMPLAIGDNRRAHLARRARGRGEVLHQRTSPCSVSQVQRPVSQNSRHCFSG